MIRELLDNLTVEQLVERLELALEAAHLGIWDLDLHDNSVQFDRRWCELLGLDHASTPMVLGTWSSRVHPDDVAERARALAACVEGHSSTYDNVHRVRHADGHWVHLLACGRTSGDDGHGKPTRLTGIVLDITASEIDRLDLLRHQHDVEQLIALLPTAVALLDTDLRYIAASDKWAAVIGFAGASLRGKAHFDLRPQSRAKWEPVYLRALAGETLEEEEERMEDTTFGEHWVRWSVRPWMRNGEIGGIVASLEDVSNSVLRRREREMAIAGGISALPFFAGGISHEINTPLQVITLAADELGRELRRDTLDRDRLLESAHSIGEMAERTATITRALRVLASDSQSDVTESVSVGEFLESARALTETRFESHGIALSFVNGCGDACVRGRPADLVRMVLNLLENAYDAASAHGHWARLEARRDHDQVVIRCIDSGAGVPLGDVGNLGTLYFTTKTDETGSGPNTGLGLSVIRALAKRGGGQFAYVPDAQHTTFELRLPIAMASPK